MITFIPGLEISDIPLDKDLLIKGKRPLLKYSYSLKDIYSEVPSLPAFETYNKLIKIFEKIDKAFTGQRNPNTSKFPKAINNEEASRLIDILFNPFIKDFANNAFIKKGFSIFEINNLSPYPLYIASSEKISHTLAWVDTNIKVNIEDLTFPLKIKDVLIQDLVHCAFEIYCYLLKHNNFFLAKNINFNYSMFFQDRILELVLGKQIYDVNKTINIGKTSNEIVLNFIKGFINLTYEQLFFYSIFIGVIWTSLEENQKSFRNHKDNELNKIEREIDKYKDSWDINHCDWFINDVVTSSRLKKIIIILDDNGESVVDIAIFQKILNDNPLVSLYFVLNESPVSNNISLQVFLSVINDEYFADFRKYLALGRIEIIMENQPFRSFELMYLSPNFYTALNQVDLVYIKGVNFFETLQIINKERYYGFTVFGMTSRILTGFEERKGVFVKLNKGQLGFEYNKPGDLKNLKSIIEKT